MSYLHRIAKRVSFLVVAAFLVGATAAMAHGPGEPASPPQFGPGTGAQFIFQGQPVTIQGVVAGVGGFGQGIQIDTGSQVISVFGVGPVWFWESQGSTFPTVGEPITIEGYQVTMSDNVSRIIAVKATTYGQTVELRDPQTGIPQWRQEAWRLWSGLNGQAQPGAQQPGQPAAPPTVSGCYPGRGYGPGMMGPWGWYGRTRGLQQAPGGTPAWNGAGGSPNQP